MCRNFFIHVADVAEAFVRAGSEKSPTQRILEGSPDEPDREHRDAG